jgi:DNA-binding SARP family transcriptional activator
MSLKIRLFGPPNIEHNGRPVELKLRKGQALLAFLVFEDKTQSRDALAAMFWPDSDQSSARASLRRTLYQVNKALDQEIIQATAETMFLDRKAASSPPGRSCRRLTTPSTKMIPVAMKTHSMIRAAT